jgi:hypothetical protein
MDPKKDFKKFFQKMFDTPVEIQGEILTPEELDRKNEEVAEVILWYIYEHSLAEDQEDKIINFGDEQFVIETAEDLYDIICLYEEE